MQRITFLIFCFVIGTESWAMAQNSVPNLVAPRISSRPTEDKKVGDIVHKRRAIDQELKQASQELDRKQNSNNPQDKAKAAAGVDVLKQIEAVLARQQNAKTRKKQLGEQVAKAEKDLERFRNERDTIAKPIGYHEFVEIKWEKAAIESRLESVRSTTTSAAASIVTARQNKETKDSAVRLAKEAVELARDPDKKSQLEAAFKVAENEARLASELLQLAMLSQENDEINRQLTDRLLELQIARVQAVEGNVRFSDSDLEEKLVEIQRQELEIRQSIKSTELNLQIAERDLTEATQRLGEVTGDPAGEAELQARLRQLVLRQAQFDVLNLQRERLAKSRETWNRRKRVFNGQVSNSELSDWAIEARSAVNKLKRDRQVLVISIDDLRKELSSLETRKNSLEQPDTGTGKWIQSQLDSASQLLLEHSRNLTNLDDFLTLNQELLTEIEGDIESWTFGERLSSLWDSSVKIWNMELVSVGERPITIGKVVLGILFLILGFYGARILSRIIGNRLLNRFGLNEGATAAIKTISFYSFFVVFALLALRFANVPLTVFTLLGGALAIGVGFGSQAIINNFISGLILLAERPIKVGDLIKLDTLVGNVTHIGARSTRVRTGDNLDIIVPNSKFLESDVLNFTLGDDKFRTHIKVGLAYGSATRNATKLLIKAADEHGLVLNDPEPFVWFRDFGDNALLFELHVWIQARTLGQRLQIESDLRYRVDQLFREGGIVIAFPQRDVHLDVSHPLQIQLQSSESTPDTVNAA